MLLLHPHENNLHHCKLSFLIRSHQEWKIKSMSTLSCIHVLCTSFAYVWNKHFIVKPFSWRTMWIFEIAGTWKFIKDQWQFIYLFIVLILSVNFFYEVPLESIYNPQIIKITTISFYAMSPSPCQCLIRPVQRPKVSGFLSSFFIGL